MGNEPGRRSYAVVIGVNGDGVFSTAESNAQAVAETLASPAFQFTTFTLTGSQATRSAVFETLQRFRMAAPPAQILIYFAGHSTLTEDDAGSRDVYLQVTRDLSGEPGVIALSELLPSGQSAPPTRLAYILDIPLPDDLPSEQNGHYTLLTGRMDTHGDSYYPITGPLLIALSSAARRHAPGEQPYTINDLARDLKQHIAAAYGQNGRFDLIEGSAPFSLLAPQTGPAVTGQPQQALRYPPPPGTQGAGRHQHRKPSRLAQWSDALIERIGLTPIISGSVIVGMFITVILVAAAVFIGRYSLQFSVVPRNQATATPVSGIPTHPELPTPYPTPTPGPSATFSTPFPPYGGYVGQLRYVFVTIQEVGSIPPGELVRISRAWFDYSNNVWKYQLVARDEQLTGEAYDWQFTLMENYNATPTARFLTASGGYIVITLERVGDIPAGASVRVSSAWYDSDIGWTYSIVAEDGVTTAEALEHQLAFKPGIDPYAPTPTSRFLNNNIGDLLTTEQVGDIPAGTRVMISQAWYEDDGWIYVIFTDDGVYAEARESQLMFEPTPTPNAYGSLTPTPSSTVPPTPTPKVYSTPTPSPISPPIELT